MSRFSMIFLFLGLFVPHMVFAFTCGPNATFSNCASPSDPTCENSTSEGTSTDVCVARCTCKPHYLRKGSLCVLPDDC